LKLICSETKYNYLALLVAEAVWRCELDQFTSEARWADRPDLSACGSWITDLENQLNKSNLFCYSELLVVIWRKKLPVCRALRFKKAQNASHC